LQTPDFPVLFIGKSTPEEWTDQRLSFFNEGEITEIVAIIKGLLGMSTPDTPYFLREQFRGALAPNEISVISPFREQVWKIRASLRNIALGAVDVGDVESLQGAEKYVHPYSSEATSSDRMFCSYSRVVIISTVRSSTRFLPDDQRFNRGVIFEAKRFNVTLTRAKELLIIVGNGDVLKVDSFSHPLLY
jgi:superfamily I DNA and/or RNA helicase